MKLRDYSLGLKIKELLQQHNLDNYVDGEMIKNWGNSDYMAKVEEKFADFIQLLGFDLSNSSIAKTPHRVVKLFINELFYGLDYRNFPKISVEDNLFEYKTPLVSKGILINSTCEHHLVSIRGFGIVSYIPKDKVVGLSKLNRVVDFFASRPQIQERMTRQIFIALQYILETPDVAVAINALHNCIITRGIKDSQSSTLTLECGGQFLHDHVLKDKFYDMAINMK